MQAFAPTMLGLVNAKEIKIVDAPPHGETASEPFTKGTLHIDRRMDEELYAEGILNEVKRRIQMMRKEAGFIEQDKVGLSISTEKELEAILKAQEKALADAVNASSVSYAPEKQMSEYTIDGRLVKLAIKKG